MDEPLLKIRRGRAGKDNFTGDVPFITNSWLKSFRDGAWVRGIPNKLYYYYHRRLIAELMDRSVVLVLCETRDEDQIVGWVCAERTDQALLVHYVYVKRDFRGHGFASKLMQVLVDAEQPAAVFYTHKTFAVRDYRDRYKGKEDQWPMKDWIYCPYLLFQKWTKTDVG